MMSREKLENVLRARGIDLQRLAGDPALVERAVGIAYKALPLPWRWFVGRRRVQRAVVGINERAPRSRPF